MTTTYEKIPPCGGWSDLRSVRGCGKCPLDCRSACQNDYYISHIGELRQVSLRLTEVENARELLQDVFLQEFNKWSKPLTQAPLLRIILIRKYIHQCREDEAESSKAAERESTSGATEGNGARKRGATPSSFPSWHPPLFVALLLSAALLLSVALSSLTGLSMAAAAALGTGR